mmetsp:Transcript_25198/g.70872  ORF Transcript_25198/g.70872 Transcript_25198/m.70872 type:complete len:200 (-) Transcript_25198:1697-2296(-)
MVIRSSSCEEDCTTEDVLTTGIAGDVRWPPTVLISVGGIEVFCTAAAPRAGRSAYVVQRERASSSSSELHASDTSPLDTKPGQETELAADTLEGSRGPCCDLAGATLRLVVGVAISATRGLIASEAACRMAASASAWQALRMQVRTSVAMGEPVPNGRGELASGLKTTRPSSKWATRSNFRSKARSSARRWRSSSMVTM